MSEAQPIQPSRPRKIRFIVDCDLDKGEVQIQGPIHQKLLAIKVLADAIHIVTDYQPTILDPRTILNNGKVPTDIKIQ
jgi:hypothetical protein